MKSKSEMDSKAGTSPKEKNQTFKNVISKSATMLLVTVMGLSAMSFVQDDSFVSGSDTNQSAAKVQNIAATKAVPGKETCCATTTIVNPGDGINTAFVIKADKETIVGFIAEVKERRIWSMTRAQASAKADKEMHFNFKLSAMYPSVSTAAEADMEMSSNFVDELVNIAAFGANAAARADEEIAGNFIAANLNIVVAKPTVVQMVKADAEIKAGFENANYPVISVPSAITAQKADLKMMQNIRLQIKLTESK